MSILFVDASPTSPPPSAVGSRKRRRLLAGDGDADGNSMVPSRKMDELDHQILSAKKRDRIDWNTEEDSLVSTSQVSDNVVQYRLRHRGGSPSGR